MINIDNYYLNTFGIWKSENKIPKSAKLIYESDTSKYYYMKKSNKIYRISDHWCTQRSCTWLLNFGTKEKLDLRDDNQFYIGSIKINELEKNNFKVSYVNKETLKFCTIKDLKVMFYSESHENFVIIEIN